MLIPYVEKFSPREPPVDGFQQALVRQCPGDYSPRVHLTLPTRDLGMGKPQNCILVSSAFRSAPDPARLEFVAPGHPSLSARGRNDPALCCSSIHRHPRVSPADWVVNASRIFPGAPHDESGKSWRQGLWVQDRWRSEGLESLIKGDCGNSFGASEDMLYKNGMRQILVRRDSGYHCPSSLIGIPTLPA